MWTPLLPPRNLPNGLGLEETSIRSDHNFVVKLRLLSIQSSILIFNLCAKCIFKFAGECPRSLIDVI